MTGPLAGVIPRLRKIALVPQSAVSDAELLDQFIARRDEAAFEVLVRRHGPMVFGVCRRVLRHQQDAEDAFQATFLVLACKAAASPRNKLAGWLHGVAHKTALKARQRDARRSEVEKRVPARGPHEMNPDSNWDEVEPLLDQELAALPERYRLPILLCDLEGRLRAEVAQTLRCSEGTLSSRLTRGRRLLAERLTRRGVHLTAGVIATMLAERSVAVAEPLVRATMPAALSTAASPSVAALATGVMKSMFLKKLQTAAFAALATVALALTGVVYESKAAPVPNRPAPAAPDDKAITEALADVDGHLLMNRKVLKDMKIDFDQFDKIQDALEEAQKKANQKTNEVIIQFKQNAAGGANIGPMMRAAQEEGEKEFRKSVAVVVKDILTPAQRARLRQIDLQARGHEAFLMPSVAKALILTDKQKEQLAANAKQVEEDIAQALPKPVNGAVGGFGGLDIEKVARDARAEGLKRALAILTDDQKAGWKNLTGEPFTHPISNPRWGQGGGRLPIIRGGGGVAPAVPLPIKPILPVKPLPPDQPEK